MATERIVPIPGHPGYHVSDQGGVYSSWTGRGRGAHIGDSLHPMRIAVTGDGRAQVNLRRKTYRVCSLVLTAFQGARPEGMQACHFPDPNPSNNHLDNLRWDTASENQGRDRVLHGTSNDGARNGSARLTSLQVQEARNRAMNGETQQSIAADYGVSRSAIQFAVTGKTWSRAAV